MIAQVKTPNSWSLGLIVAKTESIAETALF